MKGKKFYIILAGLLLIGITSIYFFRQQQENQYLEFEAFEIASVEARVNKLYNEDKTDISENIADDEFDEINELLQDLNSKDFHPKNVERLVAVEKEYQTAMEMNALEVNIKDLFVEKEIIEENISVNAIEDYETQLQSFQEKMAYYDRNSQALESAKQQARDMEEAIVFVANLFEDDLVRMDITRENEEEAHELVEKIKNKEVRKRLLAQLETVNLALNEAEEALALEEALAEETDELEYEEAEEPYESSGDTGWSPDDSGSTWTPAPEPPVYVPDNTEDDSSTGGTGVTTPEPEPDPEPEPAPEPEPEPDPEPEPEPEIPPIEDEDIEEQAVESEDE